MSNICLFLSNHIDQRMQLTITVCPKIILFLPSSRPRFAANSSCKDLEATQINLIFSKTLNRRQLVKEQWISKRSRFSTFFWYKTHKFGHRTHDSCHCTSAALPLCVINFQHTNFQVSLVRSRKKTKEDHLFCIILVGILSNNSPWEDLNLWWDRNFPNGMKERK